MEWIKRIFIAIGIWGLICLAGYIVYHVAYAIGETAGYANGYSVGHETGYSLGKQAGYDEGYDSGEKVGYDEGYILGETAGYEGGYVEGIEAGLGHGYTSRDPTYKEAVTFLERDKTDKNRYDDDAYGVYVCSHFTRDVCNNAEEAGLRCAFVELRYPEGGHAIIAFDTVDKGLLYFEPQEDRQVEPKIGQHYYPRDTYLPPPFDDTIMDILVIW